MAVRADHARWFALVVAAATVALVAIGLAANMASWPGDASGCLVADDCSCERFRGSGFAQPANSWSSLAFVAVGLSVMWRGAPGGANRMTARWPYPITFGAISVGIGIGSLLFHGSMTEWGGNLDLAGMYALLAYMLMYGLARLWGRSDRWFIVTWLVLVAALVTVQWPLDNGYGKYVLVAMVPLVGLAEVRLSRTVHTDRRWLGAGLAVYVAGNLVWLLSRTGGVLCDPDTLVQGHAIWHIAGAATLAMLYGYYSSEAPTDSVAPNLQPTVAAGPPD